MDDFSILAGLGIGIASWFWLVRCMRVNGRPWWLRHLVGASLFIFPTIGLSLFFAGILGVTNEDGEPFGWSGAAMGLVVSLPMLIPLWLSWRKSNRQTINKVTNETAKAASKSPQSNAAPDSLEQALENNRQAVRAHIQKRTGKRASSYLAPRSTATTGNLHFIYEDSQGSITTREVSNWREEGVYLEGFCHKAGDVRTFRRDRIVEFLEGEFLLSSRGPISAQKKQNVDAMEILFTGFSASDREMLEDDAEAYGMIVRKTVTQNLDFLCAGPRAGSAKLEQARAQGCTVLSEDQFLDLIENGVMP